MKIRKGFVSNSSSSSFVCLVCGVIESGQNVSHEDMGMIECVNEHLVCTEHLPDNYHELMETSEESSNEDSDDYWDEEENKLPAAICPICQLQSIAPDHLAAYTYIMLGKNKEGIEEEIKAKFASFDDFMKFIVEQNNENS